MVETRGMVGHLNPCSECELVDTESWLRGRNEHELADQVGEIAAFCSNAM
ncbi:MAG: hypothetical protein ACPLTR_07285 [Thermacetogeniaceae bacterium]